MKNSSEYITTKKENVDIRKLIYPYIIRWPWYIISSILFIIIALLYIRYSTPVYSTSMSILLRDTNISRSITSSIIDDISGFSKQSNNLDNEVEILKSVRLLTQVVEELRVNHIYTRHGNVITSEVHSSTLPIFLESKKINNENQSYLIHFTVEYHYPNIILKDKQNNVEKSVKVNEFFNYGGYKLIFRPNKKLNKAKDYFDLKILPVENVAYELQNNLKIELTNDYSTVLKISYLSSSPQKAKEILTKLIYVYNQDAIADKKLEFEKTQEFINNRIAILDSELAVVENKIENLKKSNDIASMEYEVEMNVSKKNSLEAKLLEIDTDISLLNIYEKFITSVNNNELLPQDITNNGINKLDISSYNQLVLKRQELLSKGAKEDLPIVESLTENIIKSKQQVISNLNQKIKLLKSNRSNIISELTTATSVKNKAPVLENIFRNVNRQQQIKENLYLILLQKRESAAISSAIAQEKAKIVNPARAGVVPVKPVKTIIYLVAIILALLLPIGIIYLNELFRTKIESKEDLEELIKGYPIVAELPSFSKENVKMLVKNDLSTMSEAFRIMRTNVEYILSGIKKESRGHSILVTSSIKGEGKTFVSMNYTHILGQIKKKAVIVGADIRNPQLHRFSQRTKNIKGLTNYLHEDINYQDIIQVSDSDNSTHIIFSGPIPPNPTELLMSDKFPQLIKNLCNEYDYVIVDSAPLLLVSDTLNIGKYMDLTLFVTRSNFTPREVITAPLKAVEEKRLSHVAFVLNDISSSNSGYAYGYKYNYGYGYGYGQKNEKKSFLKRLKKKLF